MRVVENLQYINASFLTLTTIDALTIYNSTNQLGRKIDAAYCYDFANKLTDGYNDIPR